MVTAIALPREGDGERTAFAEAVDDSAAQVVADGLGSCFSLFVGRAEIEVRDEDRGLHGRVALADHVEEEEPFVLASRLRTHFVEDEEIDVRVPLDSLRLGLTGPFAPRLADVANHLPHGDELRRKAGGDGALHDGAGEVRFARAVVPAKEDAVAPLDARLYVVAERRDGLTGGFLPFVRCAVVRDTAMAEAGGNRRAAPLCPMSGISRAFRTSVVLERAIAALDDPLRELPVDVADAPLGDPLLTRVRIPFC